MDNEDTVISAHAPPGVDSHIRLYTLQTFAWFLSMLDGWLLDEGPAFCSKQIKGALVQVREQQAAIDSANRTSPITHRLSRATQSLAYRERLEPDEICSICRDALAEIQTQEGKIRQLSECIVETRRHVETQYSRAIGPPRGA